MTYKEMRGHGRHHSSKLDALLGHYVEVEFKDGNVKEGFLDKNTNGFRYLLKARGGIFLFLFAKTNVKKVRAVE